MKEHITEEKAIELLKKYSKDEQTFDEILKHTQAVKKIAVEFAEKIPGADIEFIKTASILHDIGCTVHPPGPEKIKHGIAGAEILRKENLPEHALVAERHIGAGLTKKDIEEQNLPLPHKDYVPETKEEKIITDADNYIFGNKLGTDKQVYEKFKKVSEECAQRVLALHKEIKEMMQEHGDK